MFHQTCMKLHVTCMLHALSAALFSAAELQTLLHCKLNFQVVSGTQLSDTKSDTKIVKSKIMALSLTDSTTSMQPLKSAPLIILYSRFEVLSMKCTAILQINQHFDIIYTE